MISVRFHGRGGQGMKTASRILGSAFFLSGFEVQDAPKYGAERRGAPISAYVRAAQTPIYDRGVILQPDLVVVADDTLIPIASAGVLSGIGINSVLLINSVDSLAAWKKRLNLSCTIVLLPASKSIQTSVESNFIGARCAGAAAKLVGVISKEALRKAISEELAGLGEAVLKNNIDMALESYGTIDSNTGITNDDRSDRSPEQYGSPNWINLACDDADKSAPTIFGGLTSIKVNTGLWRTVRPIINYSECNRCSWICSRSCPDSVININDDEFPVIDYDHCKGCMICVAQCPTHAIETIPESVAQQIDANKLDS